MYFLSQPFSLFLCNAQICYIFFRSQIKFSTYKYNWNIGRVMNEFWNPLIDKIKLTLSYFCFDIFVALSIINRKTNKKNICTRIRKWSKPIVVLLTCCIPKSKINLVLLIIIVNNNISRIVVKPNY